MYWQEGYTLVSHSDRPDLATTDPFDSLLSTLPDDCPIPTPIIKFGLLTQHVRPVNGDFEIHIDEETIESANCAVVPSETLAAVEYLLYHHTDRLSKTEKKRIGRFCEVTELDRANRLGASDSAIKKAVDKNGDQKYDFLVRSTYRCEYCDDGFDSKAARNGHLASCDKNPDADKSDTDKSSSSKSSTGNRPALGKEIRKDKGSERVSGRNPFADPGRIKDTGLHQGGGS